MLLLDYIDALLGKTLGDLLDVRRLLGQLLMQILGQLGDLMLQGELGFGHIVIGGAQIVQCICHRLEICGWQEYTEIEKLQPIIWYHCLSKSQEILLFDKLMHLLGISTSIGP